MKATAIAPSNIAFIKYWGRKDENLRLPENGSIAMNLSNLTTTTTIEFSQKYTKDEIIINGKTIKDESARAITQLDRVRTLAQINTHAKVISINNFSSSTGLSSSASGFAALTVASAKSAGLNLSEKELSILARQGSGSACRSIPDGFVQWMNGDTSETSFAKTIFNANHWNIVDVVALVSSSKKDISTSEGQTISGSSLFMDTRLKNIDNKIKKAIQYIKTKDFTAFGKLLEVEALELHAIMLTSWPSLIYWQNGTLIVMKAVKSWRNKGLETYFTINTGQDVHIICQEKNTKILVNKLKQLPEVKRVIINKPAKGARLTQNHLF
ncbi:diphosphomevalonate decarboxylase [Candidatus Roizmanbacteria bacterium CG22_combo_CG10-13_8_21_14_all_38_20]|uniref:diphosphomevalonate decarboxylase n=1 Tax=Candidatus Roizmanbacteria bacterium CG22_combo_CG10-13_8_21_14_all_38_20 TaxID=1974862 RepID=A0A2H0BU72_9BACT|nr:diphosphomevalonate decarboxylase [Candidatus Microgenomates bacterium]PIP61237.1 MAG: diphosphomevalonate decarboxylase [Candidatus Roizmanbacteria bacterium CG22_combo_CG10-13_8_21_14_all_38_20]PJC31227.1 MAG: diphosphomevalonate decarboxylase [Candidatus Roizmanbacteria bacterium CG_4_9_14_0_2_um_filter_38_17]